MKRQYEQVDRAAEAVMAAGTHDEVRGRYPEIMRRVAAALDFQMPAKGSYGNHDGIKHNKLILEKLLDDTSDVGIDLALALLGDHAWRPCDPHTIGTVLARGVNPFALHLVEQILAAGTYTREAAAFTASGPDYMVRTHICLAPETGARHGIPWDYAALNLAPSTWWDGRKLMLPTDALPHTALTAAIGQPLSRIVGHPEIDGLDVRVVGLEDTGNPSIVYLATDRLIEPVSWRQAAENMR